MEEQFTGWLRSSHRNVAVCNDCHTPKGFFAKYLNKSANGDHHVRSPLLNINRACQTCHKIPEEELKARVETIQDRTYRLRNLAMDALMDLITDLKRAKAEGKDDKQLDQARNAQRPDPVPPDFVEAENCTGFHSPQEAARILGESIDS